MYFNDITIPCHITLTDVEVCRLLGLLSSGKYRDDVPDDISAALAESEALVKTAVNDELAGLMRP